MKKIFAVYNRYGYWDTYLEGYLEADSEADALKIARERAKKFDRPEDIVSHVLELKPIDMTKGPY